MKEGALALITGPTSGIGREIARQLCEQGANLVLACRDTDAGARLAEELLGSRPGASIAVRQVDVSSGESIRALANRLRREGLALDVLVNNAGVHTAHRRPGPEGGELTFATNVLGYFRLSLDLLDLFKEGVVANGEARIVNVASTFATAPDLDDLLFERRPFAGREAYSQSKACNRMLTRALARRLEGESITVNSMAPGLVQTGLFRETKWTTRLVVRAAGLFFGRSVEQGADTAVWLASSDELRGRSGGFYSQRVEQACGFSDQEREEALWRKCEELGGREAWPA